MTNRRNATPTDSEAGPAIAFPVGLVGRVGELARLAQAAHQATGCTAIFVQGPPGIGKTALLHAFCYEIRRSGGWCASGGFAHEPQPAPFGGLANALADLARQILAEPPTRLRSLQQRLRAGSSASLLAALAPPFQSILGAQPPPSGNAVEQSARLAADLRFLFAALAQEGSPLVLCLDDLQWADRSSLEIQRRLLLEAPAPPLLIVAAIRTNSTSNPAVEVTLAELRRQRPDLQELHLAPLDQQAVTDLVAAASAEAAVDIEHSAAALHAVTQGNPLLLRQAMHVAGGTTRWLRSPASGKWVWNAASAAQLPVGEQLHSMLVQRLERLDAGTLDLLTAAACIGAGINPAFLVAVAGVEPAAMAAALEHGVAAGLLISAHPDAASGADAAPISTHCFVHGEVQRVLLERLDDEQRRHLHRRVGNHLLKNTRPAERGDVIFSVASHLGAAFDPVRDAERAPTMAAILVEAAHAALALAAIHTAADYAQGALTWTAALAGGWQTYYDLLLAVHHLAVRTALYTGDYAALDRCSRTVFAMARSPVDKAGVYKSCITAATLQGDYDLALRLLREALAAFGVRIPRQPAAWQLLAAYAQARLLLFRRSEADLRNLPTANERTWWEIGDLVTSAYMAMQWSGRNLLMAYLSLHGVCWSLQHGHTPLSVIAYAMYSVLLTTRFGDRAAGAAMAQLAIDLSSRPENQHQRAGVLLTLNALVFHRTQPLAATVEPLRQARELALHAGDVRLATDCTLAYAHHAQLAGMALDKLVEELAAMLAGLEPFGETIPLLVARLMLQNLRNLAGESAEPWVLAGSACNEEEVLEQFVQTSNRFGMNAFYTMKATLCLLFGRPHEAVQAADLARTHAEAVGIGLFAEAVSCQIDALARLASYRAAPPGAQRRLLAQVREDVRQLGRWAARAPANHCHRLHLVQAELARSEGRHDAAAQHYEAAWALAAAHGFVQDEGGAAELAARHCLSREEYTEAAGWRQRAWAAYTRWGSRAKLDYLDRTLPVLATEAAPAPPAVADRIELPEAASGAQITRLIGDMRSLSAYVDPQHMLKHLLSTVLARLDASRAAFLLRHEGRTLLYADLYAGQDEPVYPALALDDEAALLAPLSLLRLGLHQQAAVRVGPQEVASLGARDPYLRAEAPLSVLCTPLFGHGHIVALLLVEREHDGSHPQRVSFDATDALYAELLGTRAALLIENSQLRGRLVSSSEPAARPAGEGGLAAWLLGTMRVVHEGHDIVPQLQGRLRDLAALLLLQPPGKPLTRSEIAALLWPDTNESQALTNVRNLLHKLRSAWPAAAGLLEISRHALQWQAEVTVWVDVHAFERGLAEASHLTGAAAIHLLRTSIALYAGDLLPGMGEEWLFPRQEHLRQQYQGALARLANLLVEQHDLAGALHHAHLLAAAAPQREEPYRHLIRIHALAGDITAARQAYAACAAMLAREFDATPSPATEAVYRQFAA